jgi:microcystin-dependent protein
MFGGNFAPAGWMFCSGQILAISEYSTLFNLIGTTYGGNGTSTFGLPNLQGRIPVHQGTSPVGISYVIGQSAGEETHTLLVNEIPIHTHQVTAMGAGTTNTVAGNTYGGAGLTAFKAAIGDQMNPNVVQPNPGGLPHDNMMPFLAVSFIISLFGVFPSRS